MPTCSYSATVLRALTLTHRQNAGLRVLALRSSGYGERLTDKLASVGVGVTLMDDSAVDEAAQQSTLALVGADRLLPSGAIINGSPTLLLARACQKAGRPFYVACDTFKLGEGEEREPGLDLVPPELVTGVFTERGFHKPEEVSTLLG